MKLKHSLCYHGSNALYGGGIRLHTANIGKIHVSLSFFKLRKTSHLNGADYTYVSSEYLVIFNFPEQHFCAVL